MRLVAGAQLKERQTLANFKRVYVLSQLLKELVEKLPKRAFLGRLRYRKILKAFRFYIDQTILCVTNAKRVSRKQRKAFNEILKAAGYLDAKTPQGDFVETYLKLTAYIGVRINKTPQEVAESVTNDEVPFILKALAKRDFDQALAMIQAYHKPNDLIEELQRHLQDINSRLFGETKKEWHEKKVYSTKRAFEIACMQPC